MTWRRRGHSFGASGPEYHRLRPSYPDAAIDWMLPGSPSRVLDLGAGTGKLTESLVARGHDVVAVEPDPGMLRVLREHLPHVETLAGTAEALELPDSWVDAVVVGQAWHWMDPDRAGAEIGRVLRPGGSLAMAWNSQRPDQDLVRAMETVQPAPRGRQLVTEQGPGDPFGSVEIARFAWTRELLMADFIAEWTTHSTWLIASEQEQAARMCHWQALAGELPERVQVEYETEVWRLFRP